MKTTHLTGFQPFQNPGSLLTRPHSLIVLMSVLGALANDTLGLAAASILTLLVLPLLAGLATMAWIARGDSSDLVRLMALRTACAVAILAPVLALPGTILGWVGVSGLIFTTCLLTNSKT